MSGSKPDMSCARVVQYKSSNIGAAERHNERKNTNYENLNVVPERIPMNVHFRDPGDKSYMEILREMEKEGKVSTRGLRQDATLFDEIVIDVNTMYFENHGGYEYAKEFYETAFHFLEEKFGADNVISAVMHADERNLAASEDLGKEVYHYHLHAVVLPVVEKEIRWSKRCKNQALRGTVKAVVNQISHSKKWASDVPLTNEQGQIIRRSNGKPKYRKSYSVLQDELYDYLKEHGYRDFQRGERGSTAENLKSLQYQISKDKERLADIQERIEQAEIEYEPAVGVQKTYAEIDGMGKKGITGKYSISGTDYEQLTALAKEGITSRAEIRKRDESISYYRENYYRSSNRLDALQKKYDQLVEKCRPFLDAMEHFPALVKAFTDSVKELFTQKAAQEKAERERQLAERERLRAARRKKNRDRGEER